MHQFEWNREPLAHRAPLELRRDSAMRDLTEGAVPPSSELSDRIASLSDQSAVGFIDAHEAPKIPHAPIVADRKVEIVRPDPPGLERLSISKSNWELPSSRALEALAAGPASGLPGEDFRRRRHREGPVLSDVVRPVVLQVVGRDHIRVGAGAVDPAFHDDNVGPTFEVDGDDLVISKGSLQSGRADAQTEFVFVPDSPNRPWVGVTAMSSHDPISPCSAQFTLDPPPVKELVVGLITVEERRLPRS